MKSSIPTLSKKSMTKLLNREFRKKILLSYGTNDKYGIFPYAKYLCDAQILQKMQGYDNDVKSGWGFPQLNVICCIRKSGEVDKRLFEFSTVNHFLKDKDGDSALEVLSCILIMWLNSEKSDIDSFDYEKIDAELARLDEEIRQKQLKDAAIEKMSSRISSVVEPILKNCHYYKQYEEVAEAMTKKVSDVMQQFKDAGDVVDFCISLDRNTEKTISNKEFHLDIGFKLCKDDDFSVIVTDVMLNSGVFHYANAQETNT